MYHWFYMFPSLWSDILHTWVLGFVEAAVGFTLQIVKYIGHHNIDRNYSQSFLKLYYKNKSGCACIFVSLVAQFKKKLDICYLKQDFVCFCECKCAVF